MTTDQCRSSTAPAGQQGQNNTDAADRQQLREQIARTRRQLGETVEALAAKADVKARVRRQVGQVKAALPGQARHTARATRERTAAFAARASQTAAQRHEEPEGQQDGSVDRPSVMAGGGLAAAVAVAGVAAAVWVVRRRRAGQQGRWRRAAAAARQSTVAGAAADLGGRAAGSARQAAVSPQVRPRAQGAAAMAGAWLVAGWLRRRRMRRQVRGGR